MLELLSVLCSVPDPPEIEPTISLDPSAGKSARVRLRGKKKKKAAAKTGLAKTRGEAPNGSISALLSGLTIGSSQ